MNFLTPMKCSVYRLAQAIKVSRSRLNDLVLGRRGVTTDTALRLGRYFGTTPEFWIKSPDPLRSRRCRTHRARQDRTGDRAVRRVNGLDPQVEIEAQGAAFEGREGGTCSFIKSRKSSRKMRNGLPASWRRSLSTR